MAKTFSFLAVGFVLITAFRCSPPETVVQRYDLVVEGGRVMDPESGLDAVCNLGIQGGRVEEISTNPLEGERIIAARGLVVVPGFIDLHAHGQSEEAFRLMVQDGVTSAFELEVGTGDVSTWYREREEGQILNYGVSIGHIPVRMKVMGDRGGLVPSGPGGSKSATEEQIAEMERLIQEGLGQGAVAVGFGLAYTPAATAAEFETMLRIVAEHGTSAHIHVRGVSSLSRIPTLEGVNEAIAGAAATGASLHVVHVNSSGGAAIAEFLTTIEQARGRGQDVTTEAYPYEAGMTMLESALFDDWESWKEDRFSSLQWVATGERLTRETFIQNRKEGGGVIIHSRTEEMTRTAIENPLTIIASDGIIGHPRISGTYSKVLGKYVRDQAALTLMEALRKMTIEPAQRLAGYVPTMQKKGRLSVGADADITIFDAATVMDRSTYTNPAVPSDGIAYVLVNGVLVVEAGELVPDTRPGRAIRAP